MMDNENDHESISDEKQNLIKRLRLSWFNRECSSQELVDFQGFVFTF